MAQKLTPAEVTHLIDPTKDQDELIGKELVRVLGLKVKGDRISTDWGNKTYVGLTRSVRRILEQKT